jgi:hypothetical protein
MIRNKDGTIFKLQGPNPLLKDQEWTPDENLELENFYWEEEVVNDSVGRITIPKVESPISSKPEIASEPPSPTPLPLPTPPKPQPQGINQENVVIMHCLPVIVRKNTDELYDDSYSRMTYGQKFMIESIMIERSDLGIIFWTTTKLEPNSIVFPSVYKTGIKYGEYRWWKVLEMEPKSGGYLVRAIFSEVQPEFSS